MATEHAALYEALASRDHERAGTIMTRHIEQAWSHVQRFLAQGGQRTGTPRPSTRAELAAPPDGDAAHPRRTVPAILAVLIGTTLPLFLLTSLAVQLRQALGFGVARLGLALAVYYLASACFSVPSGQLSERVGGNRVLRASGLMCAASLVSVAALVHSWTGLVIALGCAGAAASAVQPAANLLLLEFIPGHRQGTAFGIKQTAIPAAALLGGLAVPGIALTIGWRWAFLLAALLTAAATGWLPRDGPGHQPPPRRGTRARAGPAAPLLPLVVVSVGFGFALIAASALAGFLVSSGVEAGLAKGSAGLVAALAGATGLAARLTAGVLADRRRSALFVPVALMLLIGSVGYLGLAVSTGAHRTLLFTLGAIVAFGAGWGWNGLFSLAVVRAYPAAPAWATGVSQTGGRLGSMIGPLAFGLAAASVSYTAAWAVAAGAACASAAAMAVGHRLLADASRPLGAGDAGCAPPGPPLPPADSGPLT